MSVLFICLLCVFSFFSKGADDKESRSLELVSASIKVGDDKTSVTEPDVPVEVGVEKSLSSDLVNTPVASKPLVSSHWALNATLQRAMKKREQELITPTYFAKDANDKMDQRTYDIFNAILKSPWIFFTNKRILQGLANTIRIDFEHYSSSEEQYSKNLFLKLLIYDGDKDYSNIISHITPSAYSKRLAEALVFHAIISKHAVSRAVAINFVRMPQLYNEELVPEVLMHIMMSDPDIKVRIEALHALVDRELSEQEYQTLLSANIILDLETNQPLQYIKQQLKEHKENLGGSFATAEGYTNTAPVSYVGTILPIFPFVLSSDDLHIREEAIVILDKMLDPLTLRELDSKQIVPIRTQLNTMNQWNALKSAEIIEKAKQLHRRIKKSTNIIRRCIYAMGL